MKAAAKEETPDINEVTHQVAERCHTACHRAKEIVIKNPIPTVFGLLVFGAAVGYLVYSSREEASLYDRLADEADTARKRLRSAKSRLSSVLHDGVDRASRHAHKASDALHDLPTDEVLERVSTSLNRLANRLKFW